MTSSSAAEELERLQLSDEDTEELWNSPSQRRAKSVIQKTSTTPTPAERPQPRESDTVYDQEEAHEQALRNELHRVRAVNQAIEGVLHSLQQARGNMENVSRTVDSASTLMNTWTRILSQTEHNQRLLLNPKWQGASNDIAEMEIEAAAKQQAAERREKELQERREAAKKTEEDKKRAESVTTTRGRGTTRGRVVRGGLGRTTSVSSKGKAGTQTSSSTSTRRPVSGLARGSSGTARARGKP
ncbi:DASH complex subunit Duo1-domain-containing protein [Talaromyces proteolyticus]|uniref:DASH complex subunit DUO1 n=1 Tax=Talaromyces proteolyticus TaxID=1131652 RepID=A0AAD4PYN6_9EURO|nr:DASH complex subunit Duo1-domain-containing protein [Talaromyces proteolyticus]KAH8695353.1 DASH complex subunit Duo1-domain-containing protein [Talaromyces proteolyticus]